ncbi:MAG: hypothetical protein ABI318_12510 [Chthoniobacteraceae bacterium]
MRHSSSSPQSGSALIVTLTTVAALSFMAAYALTRTAPRVRMAYQNAAWQEARVAAEAGIDSAMNDLLLNATGFSPGAWTNWKQESAPAPAPGGTTKSGGLLGGLLGGITGMVSGLLGGLLGGGGAGGTSGSGTTGSGSSVTSAAPIYLDNIRLSAVTGIPTEVDIRLWALTPNANPNARWFRIRCMATCALPPSAYEAPANLDAHLRRFSLRSVRPSLRKDDPGKPSTIKLPNVSRTIEVLVEPILSFELALWTGGGITLSHSGAWNIDSFDSTDPDKSGPGGIYPGRGSPQVQANGDIASSTEPVFGSPNGATIAANGTRVGGAAATDGGDDPNTKEHENVSGDFGMDPARIHDDFNRQMIPLIRPSGEFLAPPKGSVFLTGTEDAPTIYSVHGNLSDFQITPPATGTGAVILMIDGNLDLAKPLVIPPSVIAVLFVRGNMTFRDSVNSGPSASNRASHLLIFGDGTDYQHQTLRAYGPASVCAAFYGPRTDAALDGSVDWSGSLSALTFQVGSGGNGGIHYDESLATVGPTIGFRIARYIEDVRE